MAQEKNFEKKIRNYIESIGGWSVKFFANGMTQRGIPDLLCCINGKFVAIEVKADNGRPSPLQRWTLNKIVESGGYSILAFPKDWEFIRDKLDEINRGEV